MELKANRLGEMLLEAGLIDQFQLDSALSMQRNLGGRIGSALVKLGYLPEETILEFLESQAKFSRISLSDLEVPADLLTLIPAQQMLHLLVIPIEMRHQGKEKNLRVAMTDPTNQTLIDDLQFTTGCRVLPELAPEDEIRQALKKNLPPDPSEEIDPSQWPELSADSGDDPALDYNIVNVDSLVNIESQPSNEPRFDRLLKILQEKGVLSALEIERIKTD